MDKKLKQLDRAIERLTAERHKVYVDSAEHQYEVGIAYY